MSRSHLSTTLLTSLTLALGVGSLAGCDTADQKFDCAQICGRYQDCFDNGYDTDTCRNRCEQNADTQTGFADHADACENCLDDRSCAGSFACVSECSGIVP